MLSETVIQIIFPAGGKKRLTLQCVFLKIPTTSILRSQTISLHGKNGLFPEFLAAQEILVPSPSKLHLKVHYCLWSWLYFGSAVRKLSLSAQS